MRSTTRNTRTYAGSLRGTIVSGHRRAGYLFQNRFKSFLVGQEPYLRELVRYIHLNPLRAHLVRTLQDLDDFPWAWSSRFKP